MRRLAGAAAFVLGTLAGGIELGCEDCTPLTLDAIPTGSYRIVESAGVDDTWRGSVVVTDATVAIHLTNRSGEPLEAVYSRVSDGR